MSDVMQDLRDRRARIWEQAKALADYAANENRAFTGTEEAQWQELNDRLNDLDQRITQIAEGEKRAKDATDSYESLMGKPAGSGPARLSEADKALDAQLRRAVLKNDPTPVDVTWGSDRRSGFNPGLERRDLLTTTGTGLTPTTFYRRIVDSLVDASSILSAGATVVTSESGEALKVPRSTAMSAPAIVTEGGLIGESDPTLGVVNLTAFKYGHLMDVSTELAADSTFDLLGYLARESAMAIANAFGNHAIVGTGSGQPRGVTLDGSTGVTSPTGVAGGFGTHTTAGQGGDLLADLLASLAEPYLRQPACAWMCRATTLNTIRKFRTSTGEYVFRLDAPAGSGASGTIFGKPVYADPNVAATGLNAKSLLLADWSRVFVRMVGGLRFESTQHLRFDRDLTTFRALFRLDSALVDPSALKWFVGAAT
jgi:HK97 family phage major capsid protein